MNKFIMIITLLGLSAPSWAALDWGGTQHTNVLFKTAGDEDLAVDIYLPDTSEPSPVVIYTHGGGWATGTSANIESGYSEIVALDLLEAGIAVVSVNYRYASDGNTMQTCVIDSKDAYRFISQHAETYNIDKTRMAAWGDSAGAHLAMMCTVTDNDNEAFAGDAALSAYHDYVIRGCVAWYGPVSFLEEHSADWSAAGRSLAGFYARIYDDETDPDIQAYMQDLVSPISYMEATTPPVYMIHGIDDTTIPIFHVDIMEERADEVVNTGFGFQKVENADHNFRQSGTLAIDPSWQELVALTVEKLVQYVGDNSAPEADDLAVQCDEDDSVGITLSGYDVNGDALSYSVLTSPANGTLSGTAPNLTYTPASGFFGNDSFTYMADDGTTNSAAATVSITVTNLPPVAVAQTVSAMVDTPVAITLTGSDPEGVTNLVYTVMDLPANGVLTGTAPDLTYEPNADFQGEDQFTFVVNDGVYDSALATVTITVTGVHIDQTSGKRVDDRDSNGLGDASASNGLVGWYTDGAAKNFSMNRVCVFQMTGVSDPSQITGADFSVSLSSITGTPDFNVDAHVIRTSTNSTVLVSDYETTAGTLMEDFVITTTTVGSTNSLDTAGESALVTYLQNNWVDGEYIFIGLKTDPLTLSGASSKYYVFDPDAQLSVSSSAAPVYGEQLIGRDDFDGDSDYESRSITGGINGINNLWGIINRDTVVTDEVIDTSAAAGGAVALDTADTVGFLGTNKTDNVFGMYRAGASRTLVYTFDVSGVQDLKMEMDWICSGDMADKNVSVSCSMDGGATQTVFDVGTDGDNWNETLDNGTVLDRNRNASVLTNGISAAHLTDVFQTYAVSVDGTGSNLTVMIVMDSTVGGFGGIGLDNLKLYGSAQALEGYGLWISGYDLSGTNAAENANPDGDQYSNLEEYIAGLNPDVADSFDILNFTGAAGSAFEWNAASGRVYNIYWSSNLIDGFSLIESNVAAGAFSDAAHTNAPQGYYKITVELAP